MTERRLRRRDLLALALTGGYAWLAWNASAGAAFDPVWAAIQERGAMSVATDPGFRPFADRQGATLVGYDIDLARAIAARLGLGVVFVPTGFDALYDALTSRQADLVAAALPYAPEFAHRARFSTPYFDAGLVLLVRETAPIRGPDDLAGALLGVVLGSDGDSYARRLVAAKPAIDLRSIYDEPAAAIADLRRGVLDAVITDNVAGLTAVQRTPQLRMAAALTSEPYVLAVAPAAFRLHTEVNRVLAELRATDFFARLNERWLR